VAEALIRKGLLLLPEVDAYLAKLLLQSRSQAAGDLAVLLARAVKDGLAGYADVSMSLELLSKLSAGTGSSEGMAQLLSQARQSSRARAALRAGLPDLAGLKDKQDPPGFHQQVRTRLKLLFMMLWCCGLMGMLHAATAVVERAMQVQQAQMDTCLPTKLNLLESYCTALLAAFRLYVCPTIGSPTFLKPFALALPATLFVNCRWRSCLRTLRAAQWPTQRRSCTRHSWRSCARLACSTWMM
jgi:hypothetical protein